MPSTADQVKQKLTDLVPTLVGKSNFTAWATSLEWILNSHDPLYYKLLTGSYTKPRATNSPQPAHIESSARTKWDTVSNYLLTLLHATIHPTLKPRISDADDAFAAYSTLHGAFTSRPIQSSFVFPRNRRLRDTNQAEDQARYFKKETDDQRIHAFLREFKQRDSGLRQIAWLLADEKFQTL